MFSEFLIFWQIPRKSKINEPNLNLSYIIYFFNEYIV